MQYHITEANHAIIEAALVAENLEYGQLFFGPLTRLFIGVVGETSEKVNWYEDTEIIKWSCSSGVESMQRPADSYNFKSMQRPGCRISSK